MKYPYEFFAPNEMNNPEIFRIIRAFVAIFNKQFGEK